MVTKQHSILLAGIAVVALCVAASVSPNDSALRAQRHRSCISMMQPDPDDWPDVALSTLSTSPELLPTRVTKPKASVPPRLLDAAICPAKVVPSAPVRVQSYRAPFVSLHAILPLSVPSDRAPPSI